MIYSSRAARTETLELRLLDAPARGGSALRLRAHRDELIAIELELAEIAPTCQRWFPADITHLNHMPFPNWMRRTPITVPFSMGVLTFTGMVCHQAQSQQNWLPCGDPRSRHRKSWIRSQSTARQQPTRTPY